MTWWLKRRRRHQGISNLVYISLDGKLFRRKSEDVDVGVSVEQRLGHMESIEFQTGLGERVTDIALK